MTLSVATSRKQLQNANFDKNLAVAICGGGNGAHVAAGYLASIGYEVYVLTRQPQKWKSSIEVDTKGSSWEYKKNIVGKLKFVGSDAASIIPKVNIIIIAAPAHVHPILLERIGPYIQKGTCLGALFAQGGFDWAVRRALGKKMDQLDLLFGLQNIPWICKATVYGQKCKIIGPKQMLYVACYPVTKKEKAATLMEGLFDIPCQSVANFLCLTLTPSNQIIHPARYYGIFQDWDGKKTYTKEDIKARNGLTLYADMDAFSAEEMTVLDNELQQIKMALIAQCPGLDLTDVLPLKQRVIKHYGKDVADTSSLQSVFATNLGYAGCTTPLLEVSPGKFHPVVDSRLFWEDIPYGLCILKNLAEMLGNFPTPKIDFFIRWHQQFMNIEFLLPNNQLNPQELWRTGCPNKYGIHTLKDLVSTSIRPEMRYYQYPNSKL